MALKSLPILRAHLNENISAALISTAQSTLMLFFLLFPLTFMELILHEGGHALNNLTQGSSIDVFYAHPFTFNGYVRPFSDMNTVAPITRSIQSFRRACTAIYPRSVGEI